MVFMGKYIFDSTGNIRPFAKDAVSMTISSDSGKGSLKSVLAFNSPHFRIGANESVLLAYMKATEESISLELLFESSWLQSILHYAKMLKIPIFITGSDQKSLKIKSIPSGKIFSKTHIL